MTLREQLAARFYKIGSDADEPRGDDFRWNCASHVCLALADECIRQMEWARHCGMNEDLRAFRCEGMPQLKLAPEDWTP